MRKIKLVILFFGLFLLPISVFAQNISDYLITNDIGSYTKITSGGATGSILAGIDHFYLDHSDTVLGIAYVNDAQKMWVDVQVTQHTGGESDRWLLHEVDAEFRNYYGIPGESYGPEQIDGKTILQDDVAGANYRWLSGNKVIEIKYRDSEMTKPEPLEIVKAYLAKHPSTITSFTLQQLRSNTSLTKWIKDEIDRRLWLCDKWNAQSQAGSVTQADLIYNLVRSMNVFLNYRQKYYGVSAKDDLDLLSSYKENKDIASIQKKLTDYKTWWSKHKEKRISL